MTELKRALPAFLAFIVIGLVASLGWAAFQAPPSVLIESSILWWKLRSGALLFIGFFPALFTSGLVTGYAIAFAPRKNEAPRVTPRWSADHVEQLRGAFILCIVVLAVYMILGEGIKPVLIRFQESDLAKSEDFREYLRLSEEDIARNAFVEAQSRVEFALRIRKDDRDALRLREVVRKGLADMGDLTVMMEGDAAETDDLAFNPENLTVRSSMARSSEALTAGDYYTSHYYAMLAWRLAPGTDPLKQDALRLASEAWNRVTEGAIAANPREAELFDVKRAGYESIQNGDFLNAYYILVGLRDREKGDDVGGNDPDVDRLLAIATQGLLDTRFFLDETYSLEAFESDRNVFFTVDRVDGGRDAVFIRGISYSRANGRDLAYLRGFEYATFRPDGSLLYQYRTPYAKMFPWRDGDGVERPEILLRAVDRTRRDVGTAPAIIGGEASERDLGVLVLDMPYADFSMATLANGGSAHMDLGDLMRFVDRADRYGFSSRVFLREIIMRLADPFIVLIVAMFMLTLGWKYRLVGNVYFRAWWILPLPALPFILAGFLESARYFTALFVAVFVGATPAASPFLSLLFLAAGFIATTALFFSQRSE